MKAQPELVSRMLTALQELSDASLENVSFRHEAYFRAGVFDALDELAFRDEQYRRELAANPQAWGAFS